MDEAVSQNDGTNINEQDSLQEIYDPQDSNEIQQEIDQLKEVKVIDSDLHAKLNHISNMSLTQVKTDSVSMFEMNDDNDNSQQLPSKCRLLEIEHNGKRMFIYKTTAVWLLQEGEHVSVDRLFKLQQTQPYIRS